MNCNLLERRENLNIRNIIGGNHGHAPRLWTSGICMSCAHCSWHLIYETDQPRKESTLFMNFASTSMCTVPASSQLHLPAASPAYDSVRLTTNEHDSSWPMSHSTAGDANEGCTGNELTHGLDPVYNNCTFFKSK